MGNTVHSNIAYNVQAFVKAARMQLTLTASVQPLAQMPCKAQFIMDDYKQIAYKLQTDIEMKVWENAQKNIPFLKEMKQRLQKYQNNKDATQLEMVFQMIDDWIAELEAVS